MASNKPHLNLVFIGHVDHGKSTTVGRLLFEKGVIGEHIIRQYKEEAEKKGLSLPGLWIDLKKREKEVLPLISLTRRWRLRSTSSQL